MENFIHRQGFIHKKINRSKNSAFRSWISPETVAGLFFAGYYDFINNVQYNNVRIIDKDGKIMSPEEGAIWLKNIRIIFNKKGDLIVESE